MKKVLIAVLSLIMTVCCFTFGVSAADTSFKVDISGATAVTPGETVKYTVEVKDINVPSSNPDDYASGVASLTVFVKYDTAFFDGSDISVKMPSLTNGVWLTSHKLSDGTVKIEAASDIDNGTGKFPAVSENGVLKFEISIKVKENAVAGSGKEIYISSETQGYGADFNEVTSVTCTSLDVSLIKKLDKPEGLVIDVDDNYKAKWNAVENADSYVIQVYKDGEALGKPLASEGTSYDLSTLIKNNLGGAYTFTVVAKSDSELYKDSDAATSGVCNYQGKLATPSITLTVDKIAGTVGYKITDTNPEDSVSTYIITIYDKDGNVASEIPTSKLDGTISGLTYGAKYEATVMANSSTLSNVESGNLSSDESDKVSVTPDGIVGISVTKKPTLSYTEGDTIDLSKMEITVDFAAASDVKIGKDKFSQYGITVSPKHGADAILSLNGKKITVTCGTLTAAEELTLEVKSGQCAHTTTTPEHEDATCGKDGYDKVVCNVCGVAVESTTIPATGDHNFSEWEWLSKPTVNVDGVRERICSVCGEVDHEQVTYAEYLAMNSEGTTAPPNTTPNDTSNGDTDPPVTTERRKSSALGGVADLGKIFLFALIAVLLVIVVFIIGAIYVESRRNRRRRSRSRTNQARNGQGRSGQGRSNQNRNNYRR